MNQKLERGEKLKSRKQIKGLFLKNRHVFSYPVKLIWAPSNKVEDFPVRLLVSVSKRSFKKAVDRNRMKRIIREAYRKNKSIIYSEISQDENQNLLGILYVAKELLAYDEVEAGIIKGLKKMKRELNNKPE